MTQVSILPDRVKTLRKARKIGRPKLAKLTGLTERQLTKLESSAGTDLPEPSVERLADALNITPMVLTGELALLDEDLKPASTCTSGCCG